MRGWFQPIGARAETTAADIAVVSNRLEHVRYVPLMFFNFLSIKINYYYNII